jgi:hypothetical protein
MSDCKDKKCKDCNEDYLQGMLPCVTLPELCVDGETCEETYNAQCVRYTGTPIVCGTTTVLSTGMTTEEALRSLANAICLSGGGGLVDLGPLQLCCTTNTTNITTLQNNYTVINNTVNTITNQISTINTNLTIINGQITDLQACCDASVKFCGTAPEFPFSYGVIGCQTPAGDEAIVGQDFFYIDKFSAGLSHSNYSGITTGGFGGTRLQLPPPATASAFYIEASADLFGLSWNPALPNSQYYKTVQAVLGVTGIPYSQTDLLAKGVNTVIGIQGAAGMTTFNDNHINFSNPTLNPLLMSAVGIQGVASLSNIENIGGEFLSLWRNFQTAPNTAVRGKASGSDLNTGYDIEVGKTTDTNRTNIGGKIVVKSGTGGTNYGLIVDITQAQGTNYVLQLKDTTAAAGKFLKAIDSDGNAIWDTITIPGGNVTNGNNNGTTNYITKWLSGTDIGDSQIVDDGQTVSIGMPAPAKFSVETSAQNTTIFAENTHANGGQGISGIATGSGTGTNVGVHGFAGYSSTTNIGVNAVADISSANLNIGIVAKASGATNNYAAQLIDQTANVVGRYLRNMTTDGKANWSNINITEVTNGLSTALLGAPNGIATLDSNSKLVISQMPITVMDYKGSYDIVANVPVLVDGTGNAGDVYVNTTAGTRTFGPGNTITVGVGDWLIYNGTKWEKTLGNNVGAGTVTSVGLTVGTTGTDVSVSNSPITSAGDITINIPTASATARGVLSIADFIAFAAKASISSGTNNYVAKFTPNGTTIGNSQIQDTGSVISINETTINAGIKLNLKSDKGVGIGVTQTVQGAAFDGRSQVAGTSANTGIVTFASNSTVQNVGIESNATSGTTSTNIAVKGYAAGGANNHCFQGQDGTQAENKFLKSVTSTGMANWAYLPDSAQIMMSDMTSAITADAGTPKAFWAAPCNGTFTDMFASLRVPQVGGSTFTVLVKSSAVTLATLTFTNGSAQYMSTNPAATQAFSKGDLVEFYVSQVGDGTARSLIVTLNYVRT